MNHRLLVLVGSVLMASGCAKTNFAPDGLGSAQPMGPSEKIHAACEMTEIDYTVDATVVEFSMTSKLGANFGFNLASGFFKAFDAEFNLSTSTLTAATNFAPFLNPDLKAAQFNGQGKQRLGHGSVGINFGIFSTGVSGDTSTSILNVVDQALKKSTPQTVAILNTDPQPWHTIVVVSPSDEDIFIPVGSNAGLAVGDEFQIFNETLNWDGEACKSTYRGHRHTTGVPINVKIVSADDLSFNQTHLHIVDSFPHEKIEQGAYVQQLTGATKTLKRTVAVSNSQPFVISWASADGQVHQTDASPLLKNSLTNILQGSGFIVKPLDAAPTVIEIE